MRYQAVHLSVGRPTTTQPAGEEQSYSAAVATNMFGQPEPDSMPQDPRDYNTPAIFRTHARPVPAHPGHPHFGSPGAVQIFMRTKVRCTRPFRCASGVERT
jgi:hypothetical protein